MVSSIVSLGIFLWADIRNEQSPSRMYVRERSHLETRLYTCRYIAYRWVSMDIWLAQKSWKVQFLAKHKWKQSRCNGKAKNATNISRKTRLSSIWDPGPLVSALIVWCETKVHRTPPELIKLEASGPVLLEHSAKYLTSAFRHSPVYSNGKSSTCALLISYTCAGSIVCSFLVDINEWNAHDVIDMMAFYSPD